MSNFMASSTSALICASQNLAGVKLHKLDNTKTKAYKFMKRVSKTYERTSDEEDKMEFDTTCAWFQDLRSDIKTLHRMKYDLYIEGIGSGIKSDPRSFFKFANMKRISSGYSSSMFLATNYSRPRGGCELDGISPSILRTLILVVKVPLMLLFNLFLLTGIFPAVRKESLVDPILKSDEKRDISCYCEISNLLVIPKPFEKMICDETTPIIRPEFSSFIIPECLMASIVSLCFSLIM
jgi:hypothetical protein